MKAASETMMAAVRQDDSEMFMRALKAFITMAMESQEEEIES